MRRVAGRRLAVDGRRMLNLYPMHGRQKDRVHMFFEMHE
jgi:hypothetical protein